MFFASKFLAIAALALSPLISAQTSPKISITQIPGPAIIGQASTIKWSGGAGGLVTLILLEGNFPNPKTVGIIATNLNGNSYSWTPGSALVPGDDYLLKITQGLEDSNISGQFAVQSPAAAQATTIYAVAGSSTIAISTVTPNATTAAAGAGATGGSSSSANATSTVTLAPAPASASTGTVSVPRNTTFVSQSLTSTGTVTTGTATTTTATTGATGATGTSAGGAVARATAQAVLGFGAIAAAAVYLL